ncbi:zinc-binding dehydrogenase [Microbacterium sp.]|uniref:zinc-binding dehydrogenase n=1 Tax=Microbacterium sp. TaxID=51671 RepID=UPI003A8723CB
MPTTVIAAVTTAVGAPFTREELILDDPQPREVLIDTRASGLCHSDLSAVTTDMGFPLPAVYGHEVSGVVRAVGTAVTGLAVGDRAVASLVQFCGECPSCSAGRTALCRNAHATERAPDQPPRLARPDGTPVWPAFGVGGFASAVLVHEHQVARVPEAIPFPEAAILGCATITGVGAATRSATVRVGDSVAVIGLGGVGLNVLSGARLAGAETVIGVDLQPAKLDLARAFGATHVVDAGAQDPVAAVQEITGGGVDHSFEVIGLPATSLQAIRMTAIGGAANLIGIHRPGARLDLDPMELIGAQRTVRGVFMGSAVVARDVPLYADLFLQDRLNLSDLIAPEISLDHIDAACAELASGASARSVITAFG